MVPALTTISVLAHNHHPIVSMITIKDIMIIMIMITIIIIMIMIMVIIIIIIMIIMIIIITILRMQLLRKEPPKVTGCDKPVV